MSVTSSVTDTPSHSDSCRIDVVIRSSVPSSRVTVLRRIDLNGRMLPGMSTPGTRSMAAFQWTPRPPVNSQPGEDNWCLRDAFCRLLDSPSSSENWLRFIEGPCPGDIPRLIEHLNLWDIGTREEWTTPELFDGWQGVLMYRFNDGSGTGHAVFESDIGNPSGLPRVYQRLMPELHTIVVDPYNPRSLRSGT